MRSSAFTALLSMALVACSSAQDDGGDFDEAALAAAQGPLQISSIALLQTLKVPVVENGAPAPRTVPAVAGRDALVRVYVQPTAGVGPQAVTATLQLTAPGWTLAIFRINDAVKVLARDARIG